VPTFKRTKINHQSTLVVVSQVSGFTLMTLNCMSVKVNMVQEEVNGTTDVMNALH